MLIGTGFTGAAYTTGAREAQNQAGLKIRISYSSDKCRAKVNMAKAEDKETHATN